jgi:hypothetical protein
MTLRVISGAQTGADVAGLWAAKLHKIPTGGWAPKGFRTLDGFHPEMAETFGIKAHDSPSYPPRTAQNLTESDFTLICSEKMSAGTKLTINQCKKNCIPHKVFMLDPENLNLSVQEVERSPDFIRLCNQIRLNQQLGTPFVLNVAGNSTNNSARVFEFTFKVCHSLFTMLGYTHFVEDGEWKRYKDTWR